MRAGVLERQRVVEPPADIRTNPREPRPPVSGNGRRIARFPLTGAPAGAETPSETVPQGTVSSETVPGETVPSETVPSETVPSETRADGPVRVSRRRDVLGDVEAVLPDLPELFEKRDLVQALGYEPSRSTLFRALDTLREQGKIEIALYSDGGTRTQYKKLPEPM